MGSEVETVAAKITPEAVVAMAMNPAFPAAIRASVAGAIEHYATFANMRRYTRDRGSFLITLAALYLQFSPDGLTATRLKTLCVSRGVCSEGRVASVLAYMRARGDLLGIVDANDKRVRRLALGEAFLIFQRARFRVEPRAMEMAMMSPSDAGIVAAYDREDFFARYLYASSPLMLENFGDASDQSSQILNVFAEHDVGMLMLYALLENDGALESRPFKISVSAIATRLAASRVHILKLLADTHSRGLLVWRRDTREVQLQPHLVSAAITYFCIVFLLFRYYYSLLTRTEEPQLLRA